MVINPNNIKTLFDEINLDDNKNKLSTKDLSNVSLTMRPIDKYIILMLGILRHAIMLFRNIIPEFNSQKEIHLIRIIDTTKKKKISFYDSSWMRAGIVITMSVLVPSIYMATFDVYPEKKNTMEICSNKATLLRRR